MSESYTPSMARLIHNAWSDSVVARGKLRSTASCPVSSTAAEQDHQLPCCVGPALQTDSIAAAGAPSSARPPDKAYYLSGIDKQKPTAWERIDLNVTTHQRLTPGREGLWYLVAKRVTYDLQSGKLLTCHRWSGERPTGASPSADDEKTLDLPLPHCGQGMDVRTVFLLRRPLTADEIDLHVPAMPTRPVQCNVDDSGAATNAWGHIPRVDGSPWCTTNAMVARPVRPAELKSNKNAQAKMQEEIDKLVKRDVWDLSGVRSWRDVATEARSKGHKAHRGNVFGICVEKGSELPLGHPERKFKGRYVYQGNQVRDEYNEAALFNELGSSPATLEGAKAVDVWGLVAGHAIQQADASAAYTQALLGNETPQGSILKGVTACKVKTTTWVTLPPEARPKRPDGSDLWRSRNIVDPVAPLVKALYGHPDSGGVLGKALQQTFGKMRL